VPLEASDPSLVSPLYATQNFTLTFEVGNLGKTRKKYNDEITFVREKETNFNHA